MNSGRQHPSQLAPARRAHLAWRVALLGGTLAFGAPAVHAQHRLVALPINDPAYVQLETLDRLGCGVARVSAYRPFLTGLVRSALDSAARDPRCAGAVLDQLRNRWSAPDTGGTNRLRAGAAVTVAGTGLSKGEFRPLWNDVRPSSEGTPAGSLTARGRVTWEADPRLVAVAEVIAGTSRRGETTIKQRALRNTSGYIDAADAYLTGQLGPLVISFGRMPEAWFGDDRESIILSANGPPLDRVLFEAHWRRIEARAFVASIDQVRLTNAQDSIGDLPPQRFFRTLVGHSLTWRPRPAIELSLGETALLSRGSRALDLAYANPLIPYLFTGNDSTLQEADNQTNHALFATTQLRLGRALVRGELFVDEFQIDAADRKHINDQLAWRLRATVPLPAPMPTLVGAEYRRVNTYTYLQGFYSNVWQHFDRPLGSELGPDADLVRGMAELWPRGNVRVSGSVGLWRHGALRIDQRPSQRASAPGNFTEIFPSVRPERPAVQRGLLADATLQFLDFRLPITIRVEAANITNVNNQPAPAALYVRTQLIGTYAFRYP